MKQKSIKLNSLLNEKGVKPVNNAQNNSLKGGRSRYIPPVGRPKIPNPDMGLNR